MKMSQMLISTLRDVPADAVVPSHQLLLKAGYIQRTAAGMYNYLPLGYRVLKKIRSIVAEEMNRAGGQEILMPITQPAELWEESGRWDAYGDELMRFKDRHERSFCLGPTHEEVITDLVRQSISSYKHLPLRLYQIQNKYRDERRPRFGLMRSREFVMKDLYSFDIDEAGMDQAYEDMVEAYHAVFSRCGLNYRPVEADGGQIGGDMTHEFMVLAENGEATIACCPECDYAANDEIAPAPALASGNEKDQSEIEKIATPDCKTIEDVANFLNVSVKETFKTMIYEVDEELVAVLVRGDHQVNDLKLLRFLAGETIDAADENRVARIVGAGFGSLGPVNLQGMPIYADLSLKGARGFVCGANDDGYHFAHVDLERDANIAAYADFRMVQEGDSCPKCPGTLFFAKGIEVGQTFKLGTTYSEAMGATVLNQDGKATVMQMGCYGIGVSRTMAAAIEQNHDDYGMIWPKNLAPFQVHLIVVNAKKEDQLAAGHALYEELKDAGYEVLFDDRNERAGVKFNDADLIGIPVRITIGKKFDEGLFEWKLRTENESYDKTKEEVFSDLQVFYNEL